MSNDDVQQDVITQSLSRRQAVAGLAALLGAGLGLAGLRGVAARENEPGDDHGSGGNGADDPPGDDHGSGGNGADDPPGDDHGGGRDDNGGGRDDNGGGGNDDRGKKRRRRRRHS